MKVPRPWSARPGSTTAHVVIGLPVGMVLAGLTLVCAPVAALDAPRPAAFTRVQRSRFEAFLGVRIPPVRSPSATATAAPGGRSATTCSRRWWGWPGPSWSRSCGPGGRGGADGVPAADACSRTAAGVPVRPARPVRGLRLHGPRGPPAAVPGPDPGTGDGARSTCRWRARCSAPADHELGQRIETLDREPRRRDRRGRRRAPPHRARPARRRPAAAGLARHEPRAWPAPR